MEHGFGVQPLSHPALVLAGLPDALRMQLGPFPFSPQIEDLKSSNVHNVSAYRLRYGNATGGGGYGGLPAQLIQHLPPQLFPTAVDPRAFFQPAAFRPFNLSNGAPKLFSSAFAPPTPSAPPTVSLKNDENGSELSPGYVSKLYDNDDDSSFRSSSERDQDVPNLDIGRKSDTPNLSPKIIKEEKADGKPFDSPPTAESDASSLSEDERGLRSSLRPKTQFGPTCCPICGILVIVGEAEGHFFKEIDRLSQLSSLARDRKFLLDRFSGYSSYPEENGHGMENGLPRGRWETFQRVKANRLSRLRIKNRKRKSGEHPLCPVCNDKLQGNVEDINHHVEHCLKKHSEADEEEEENIDVEGDSEVYGEYEWTGRHLARASTFLGNVPGSYLWMMRTSYQNSATLLSSSSVSSQKEDEPVVTDAEEMLTPQPDAVETDITMDDERPSNLSNGSK